jgi:hypothetical protein
LGRFEKNKYIRQFLAQNEWFKVVINADFIRLFSEANVIRVMMRNRIR